MAVNIDRASDGTVTFDFGGSLDPIVLTDSNNVVVSSSETKDSLGTIIRQDISFMRSDPYFFYALTYSQIGTINGGAKPAIGEDTTDLLTTAVFQGTGGDSGDNVKLTGNQTIDGVKTFNDSPVVPDATGATEVVNLGQLDERLSANQRTAIDALVAATATAEEIVDALKAV